MAGWRRAVGQATHANPQQDVGPARGALPGRMSRPCHREGGGGARGFFFQAANLGCMTPPPPDPAERSRVGALYEAYAASIYSGMGWIARKAGGNTNAPDFGADLLVHHPDNPNDKPAFAVQCKFWADRVGVDAVQAVYAARDYYGAGDAVILANQPLTEPARQLAAKLGVEVYQVNSERWEPPSGLRAPMDIKPLTAAALPPPPRITQEHAASLVASFALRSHLKIPDKWRLTAETVSIRNFWRVELRWTREQTFFRPGQVWQGVVDVDAATSETRIMRADSAYTPERPSLP